MSEIDELHKTIAMLEAQRGVLGDAVVDAALAPLRQRLTSLGGAAANSAPAGPPPAPASSPAASENSSLEKLQTAEEEARGVEEQRKLVSVLFADLVGFTALSESMDPEDVRELLRVYFQHWTRVLASYGGLVEKFIGDAVMAVFGLPTAGEDDAERAVRAALEMRSVLETLNDQFEQRHGLRLAVRVGINTGPVVAAVRSEHPEQGFSVVGDTVNLASRLQSAAPTGGILVSHETFRLIRGAFDIEPLDPIQVKGKRDLVRVYLVARAKPRALRFEQARIESPLVGRAGEMARLMAAVERMVTEKRQQALLIAGEAGIGKSRLVNELEYRMELLPQVIRYFKGRGSPFLEQQPFALLRDMLSYRFDIQDSETAQAAAARLLEGLGGPQPANALVRLLGFSSPESASAGEPQPLPRQLYTQALQELVGYFQRSTQSYPSVIVLEDLQWADGSSVEMIGALRRELAAMPVLWVATARPECDPWILEPDGERMELEALTAQESLQLLEELLNRLHPNAAESAVESAAEPSSAGAAEPSSAGAAEPSSAGAAEPSSAGAEIPSPAAGPGGAETPAALRDLAVRSAEGNPFYLEELLRMLIEDGVLLPKASGWQVQGGRLAAVRVPPTLAEFLQARLDSLPPLDRTMLQRASVIGRVFWDRAVEYLSAGAPGTGETLNRLRDGDVILQRETSQFEGTREYVFRQNLLREATYDSLLRRQRRAYHAHAARWLEEITSASQRSGEYAALIAEHYALADEPEPAARWYGQAGLGASARYANREAVHNLTRALDLLPAGDLANRYRLMLEREKIYDRQVNRAAQAADQDALETLADAMGDLRAQAEVALRRTHLYFFTNAYVESITYAQKALRLAEACGAERLAAEAELAHGRVLFWQSENEAAREHLEKAHDMARAAGQEDLQAHCVWNLGIVLSNQGQFPSAEVLLNESRDIYRRLDDREGEGLADAQLGNIAYNLGQVERARQLWESARVIFHWTGHRLREATLCNNLAANAYTQGNWSKALELQSEALRIYKEANDFDGVAVTLTNQGELLRDEGLFEQAQASFDLAMQTVQRLNDRLAEVPLRADYCRLYLMMGDLPRAIEAGHQALALAHEIQAGHYESFSLHLLANAYRQQGNLQEAAKYFRQAAAMQRSAGMELQANENLASLAYIDLVDGQAAEAVQKIEPLLAYVLEHEATGCDDACGAYLALIRVLRAAQDPRALVVEQQARRWLLLRANNIADEAVRRSFLERVPANRALMELTNGSATL